MAKNLNFINTIRRCFRIVLFLQSLELLFHPFIPTMGNYNNQKMYLKLWLFDVVFDMKYLYLVHLCHIRIGKYVRITLSTLEMDNIFPLPLPLFTPR